VTKQVLGIDFSGSADQWSAKRRNSNVWIASGRAEDGRLLIDDLAPVQALIGDAEPFNRLIELLTDLDGVVAIDAPFSAPREYAASVPVLWAQASGLPHEGRPFGRGTDLVQLLAPGVGRHGVKVYRACEALWRRRGLNAPSILWLGPGGGGGAAVACMTLLLMRGGPVWPLRPGGEGAVLVEALPGAQLLTWGLETAGYNGPKPKAAAARTRILTALVDEHELVISDDHAALCQGNAHALDAVLCAYAAKAIAEGRHPRQLPVAARSEGWIVVDESPSASGRGPLLAATAEHKVQRQLDALMAAVGGEDGGAD
jgi:predicted nuclease with RNAse H fold